MRSPSVILGVSNTKDSGAAIICDGQVVAAANEERFNRTKLTQTLPEKSIQYVLSEAGVTCKDVDLVTTGAWKGFQASEVLQGYVDDVAHNVLREPQSLDVIRQRVKATLHRDSLFRAELIEGIQELGLQDRLTFVDHHRAHAAAAYFCSPFEHALVIVMDARGDFKSASASVGIGSTLSLVDTLSDLNSAGVVYSFVTRVLGFTPDRHEGKVTGLAAYGDAEKTRHVFEQMISVDSEGRIRAQIGKFYSPFMSAKLPHVEEILSRHDREDIAAGVQVWLENLVVSYIKEQLRRHPSKYLCLAGGVFANVKVNQRVREIAGVKNVYIHPHMGDGGVSLGSALNELYERGGSAERPLPNAYLGPQFSQRDTEKTLAEYHHRLHIREIPDIARVAAKLVAAGHVVGWFQGRMEYGPRALCNRSILVQATDPRINDTLNKRLSRTEFMPFAPVTLEENAAACYREWRPDHIASRYMTMCYDCHPDTAKKMPAVVHVDNTARPQVINPKSNHLMYRALSHYYDLTGLPSIVNTSFNNHEEPIVCEPSDAVESLLRDNVDVLCIGDYLAVTQGDPYDVFSKLYESVGCHA